jgi:hypothetical protein
MFIVKSVNQLDGDLSGVNIMAPFIVVVFSPKLN